MVWWLTASSLPSFLAHHGHPFFVTGPHALVFFPHAAQQPPMRACAVSSVAFWRFNVYSLPPARQGFQPRIFFRVKFFCPVTHHRQIAHFSLFTQVCSARQAPSPAAADRHGAVKRALFDQTQPPCSLGSNSHIKRISQELADPTVSAGVSFDHPALLATVAWHIP